MNKLINKFLNRETIIYVIFGVLTTIVDFVTFGLLYYNLNLREVLANTIAWFLAVAFAYITNKLFVFESKSFERKTLKKEIISFFSSRAKKLSIKLRSSGSVWCAVADQL